MNNFYFNKKVEYMKTKMKHLWLIGLLLVSVAACSDDKEDEIITDSKAELLSFGFYVQDNPILAEDYIAEEISGSITIRIPEEVDKTALKARFTVTDDDYLRIGSTTQVSGVTANDYTYPIDFVVTDTVANLSNKYTISVSKILLMKWTHLGNYYEPDYTSGGGCAMAVSPTENYPYLFYQQTMDSPANKGSVVKWNGSGFVRVGTAQFTAGRIYQPVIKFDKDGTPYVFYGDNSTSPTNKPTVMKYSGGTWNNVGSQGYGDAINTSAGADFAITDNGNITCFYQQNAALSLPRRELNVSYYTSGSWSPNNAMPGMPAVSGTTNVSYNPRTVAHNNIIYMALTMNGNGYGVYKYENSAWSTLADGYLIDGASGPNIRDLSMAVDSEGVPYVAIPDNSSDNATWKIQVIKYSNNNWVKVGNIIDTDVTAVRHYAMAIDKNNTPFVLYRKAIGDNTFVQIVSLDPNSLQWTEPLTLGDIPTATERVYIDFAPNGNGYAMFVSSEDLPSKHSVYNVYQYSMDTDD